VITVIMRMVFRILPERRGGSLQPCHPKDRHHKYCPST